MLLVLALVLAAAQRLAGVGRVQAILLAFFGEWACFPAPAQALAADLASQYPG